MPPPVEPKAKFSQDAAMYQDDVPGMKEMFGAFEANASAEQRGMQEGICWALSMKWINLHAINYADKGANQHKNRMDTLRKEFMPLCGLIQKAGERLYKKFRKLGLSSLATSESVVDSLSEYFLVRRVIDENGVKERGQEIRAYAHMSMEEVWNNVNAKGPKQATLEYESNARKINRGVNRVSTGVWNARSYHMLLFAMKSSDGEHAGHACAVYCSSGKIFGFGKHIYLFDPNQGEFKLTEDEFKQTLRYWRDKRYYRVRYFTIIPVEPFGPYGRNPTELDDIQPPAFRDEHGFRSQWWS